MKKYPRPPSSNRWDQFEKLTTDNNKVIEMLLRDKELKAIYSKVGNIIHLHHFEYIEDITRWREDMNVMLEWQEQYLTSEHSERVRYSSCHENIKFVSSS